MRTSLSFAALLLAACGGGGGGGSGGSAAEPTVTAMSVGAAKYSDTLLVTATGTNLDAGLTLSSAGCNSMTRSTTAPNVSNASTAYFTCTVSALGSQSVTALRSSDATALASANFMVPVPIVTVTVSNGAGVAGTMVFTLAPDKAPITVDNFLRYVRDDFYTNTVFHRVVMSPTPFVIQGGGYRIPNSPLKGLLPGIPLEVNKGLSNVQWSLAMARTADPNSANSQFFINLADNSSILDPKAGSSGYAVFGSVSAGTNVVAAIAGAPCAPLATITDAPECTPQPFMVVTSAVQTQ
jgi:peptidyl-prolyl cis-trans isomerase A (cyclophilin A)